MATTLTCAFAAPAAQADPCNYSTDENGAMVGGGFLDSAGFTWDLVADSSPNWYGIVGDGFIDQPDIGLQASDSYDGFGGVSINSPAIDEMADDGTYPYGYMSTDPAGCITEADGRQIAFPAANVQGVEVQRRWYVPATGPRGARLLTTVRNPSDEPKTISVYVHGNLGSDGSTNLVGDSTEDGAWTAADRWAVTGDRAADTNNSFSDPVVSHLVDGADGADRVDELSFAKGNDNIVMGWRDVTLAPGQQTSILSYEALTAQVDRPKSEELASARAIIAELDGLSAADRFAGLTAAQIASVRNWQRPATTASISGPATATEGEAVSFTADVGGTLPVCTTSQSWQVDGQDAGTGTKLERALSPGDVAARPAAPQADTVAPSNLTLGGIKPGRKFRVGQPTLAGKAGTAPGDAATVTVSIYQVSAGVRAAAVTARGKLVERQEVAVVNGVWSTKPVTPLVPGRYEVVASQADGAGNVAASQPIPFTVLGSCESRRAFDMHLLKVKGGYKRVKVTLNGKALKVRGKRTARVHVNLKGLPKGKQVVRISATTATGRKLSSLRAFETCEGALK
jgi:hypothetical protein